MAHSFRTLRLEGDDGIVLVDADVYVWAKNVHWKLGEWGYATNPSGVSLHRMILGLAVGDPRQGDHKSGNKLDCRRSNLRIVTYAQNRQNERARRTWGGRPPDSPYRGVFFRHTRATSPKPWFVKHRLNGKEHYGGAYATEEQANTAAIEWRKKHMPFATN